MRSIQVIIFTFLLIASPCGSLHASETGNPEKLLQSANEIYSKGEYQEAITAYKQLISGFGFSVEVLHNLANSYAGAGINGKAILNYLRGLRLSPGDDDLLGDLEMLRKNIGLFAEEPSLREKSINLFDLNQWSFLALGSYILLTLMVVLQHYLDNTRWLRPCILLAAASICLCIFGAYQQRTAWSSGVIIAPHTRLLMSPFPSSSSLGNIDEGSVVYSEKTHRNYHYIRDSRGRSGWVEEGDYEKINTSHLRYSQGGAEQ